MVHLEFTGNATEKKGLVVKLGERKRQAKLESHEIICLPKSSRRRLIMAFTANAVALRLAGTIC